MLRRVLLGCDWADAEDCVLPRRVCENRCLTRVHRGCVEFAGCDQGCLQSALAWFVAAGVDLAWSAPLEEFLQVSLLPACSWPQLLHRGVLEHTFLEVPHATAFVPQLQRLPALPSCTDCD